MLIAQETPQKKTSVPCINQRCPTVDCGVNRTYKKKKDEAYSVKGSEWITAEKKLCYLEYVRIVL